MNQLESRRSRRTFLAATAGALAASIAQILGRPLGARAADGDPILAGRTTIASDLTQLTSSSSSTPVLLVQTGGTGVGAITGRVTGGGGVGVYGESGGINSAGVSGFSDIGIGVSGSSNNGYGVFGSSPNTIGVYGQSPGDLLPAVVARAGVGGTALLAFAGPTQTSLPAVRPNTGVYGYANGDSPVPAPGAIGVYGRSGIGTGVYAQADAGGTALHVAGKVTFSRSGRTYVAAGHSSCTVTMAGVTISSWIVATPQTNRTGIHVQAVVPTAGRFTIHLNKTASGRTYIGYLVIN